MLRKVYYGFAVFLMVITAGTAGVEALANVRSRPACPTRPAVGWVRCYAQIVTDTNGLVPMASGTPQGYGPADFRAAYGGTGPATTHIGIVTAYDAPHIQSDLTVFSKAFGLPPLPGCLAANQAACFEKLNQHGVAAAYPSPDNGWSAEASLDVESAHGMCPTCRITLVEATSPSLANLSAAVDQAVAQGAKVISNSYGGPETSTEVGYDDSYRHSGVTMVVSSGDSGYGANYPAASPYVIAVGGTSLKMSKSKLISETAWAGAGSGCSAYEPKPSWQHDKRCSARSIADIAAAADPTTGAAIYDSFGNQSHSGWFTAGGTSLAAPLVAGWLATASKTAIQPARLYSSSLNIRDIISGGNGGCPSYLCRAGVGYDGPTGLGVLSRL